MSKIIIEDCGSVAILRLNNGATNAISPLLLNDLREALGEVRAKFKGMVLAGNTKFFSIGMDLPSVLKLDRTGMAEYWYNFDQLAFDIFTFPLPTVCAIAGHAIAGGNVIALTTDYRFATSEEKKIGLNEIKLGVPLPYLADLMLRKIVGDMHARDMVYHGEYMSLPEAQQIGLVDKICSPETLDEQAVKKATALASLNGRALAEIKANRTEEISIKFKENGKAKNEFFLDCWFDEQAQRMLKEASLKFRAS
jgi:enoyl-CoA hydratase/carnithine racemase